jgi:hypothetical protein
MSGEPHRVNYIQSPLVPLNEFRNLVKDHRAILIDAEQEFPEHHATVANLTHQFERHLSILIATVETYATLQQTIVHDLRELIPTAETHVIYPPCPQPPSPFVIEPVPTSTSTNIRAGRFSHYAVHKGQNTGIFTTWSARFSATNGVSNQYRRFNSSISTMVPAQSKLTIHPWLDASIYNRISSLNGIFIYTMQPRKCAHLWTSPEPSVSSPLTPIGTYIQRMPSSQPHNASAVPASVRPRPVITMTFDREMFKLEKERFEKFDEAETILHAAIV